MATRHPSRETHHAILHAVKTQPPYMPDTPARIVQAASFDAYRLGVTVPKMPPRAPNLRAHVERVIQTLQNEVLNGLVILNERHFNHILPVTQDWYNNLRSHSARDHLPPGWDKPPPVDNTANPSEITCTTRLGGLLNSYARRAA